MAHVGCKNLWNSALMWNKESKRTKRLLNYDQNQAGAYKTKEKLHRFLHQGKLSQFNVSDNRWIVSEVVSRRQKLMLPLGTPYTVLYFFKKSHTHLSNTLQRFNNFRMCQIFFGPRQYGHLVLMADKESILFSGSFFYLKCKGKEYIND